MRLNIFSCLLAFLGYNITAEINHVIIKEKSHVVLRCPRSVEDIVTWSRESDGNKVDILTTHGEEVIKHISYDRRRRYRVVTDEFPSLHIRRVTSSDAGRYFCNDEAAVELTVIPSETVRLDAAERTNVTLKCRHEDEGSHIATWSRDARDKQQQRWFYVSPADNSLTITEVQPGDSGFYYCDGKPAVYLNVIKGTYQNNRNSYTCNKTKCSNKTVPPPKTTDVTPTKNNKRRQKKREKKRDNKTQTTAAATALTETVIHTECNKTPTASSTATTLTAAAPTTAPSTAITETASLWQMCVRMVITSLYFIIMSSITVIYWRKARTNISVTQQKQKIISDLPSRRNMNGVWMTSCTA
ncbi:uncharacterized protein LOC121957907 isoform X2 [Plectropomus leopardus]|uniref:uncharacterized protein LOC121957907 isoform X2 n=1 Tax=Plectropomus leopardus TaxID=160734 RepID=UPI001C4AC254|nr:uncharacterized protein LOC121957907 isoform X2 [Plectropomus leopardus]